MLQTIGVMNTISSYDKNKSVLLVAMVAWSAYMKVTHVLVSD
jgi:hypothetical protein